MLKRIHINKHVILANRKHGRNDPPLRVKTSRENMPAYNVRILGPSELVYRPDRPLSCGARVWIETRAEVEVDALP